MESNKLKPCPFCGCEVKIWKNVGYGAVRVIECTNCRIKFVFPYYNTDFDLAEIWNRRKA